MKETKFDIGLNANLNKFCEKFKIDRSKKNDDSIFEDFTNYIISSEILGKEIDNFTDISTQKAEGIDGIIISVNDHLMNDKNAVNRIGENEEISMRFCFIQATIEKSFDKKKFGRFVDTVINFLLQTQKIEPFSTIYEELMQGGYTNRLKDTPQLDLYFVSAKTTHDIDKNFITELSDKINKRSDIANIFKLNDIHFYQKDEINKTYGQIIRFNDVLIELEGNFNLPEIEKINFGLLATIKFAELKKIILTKEGYLKDNLFIDNVRSYIGDTKVNKDIYNTLENDNKNLFPYLNNGITILCDKIERHRIDPKKFTLTFPRIINGCQTANELYKAYTTTEGIDETLIVTKIIATTDNTLASNITYAANNQNSIDKDIQNQSNFHKQIEQYFVSKQNVGLHLYFERLRGQYSTIQPKYSKVDIETLARVYISIFLKKPERIKSNAFKEIETWQKNKKIIFDNADEINKYYYCAILYYYLQYFLANDYIVLQSKTMDMHLLMTCHLFLSKKFSDDVDCMIKYIEDKSNAQDLFEKSNSFLKRQSYLFKKKGFYSSRQTKTLEENIKYESTTDNKN